MSKNRNTNEEYKMIQINRKNDPDLAKMTGVTLVAKYRKLESEVKFFKFLFKLNPFEEDSDAEKYWDDNPKITEGL